MSLKGRSGKRNRSELERICRHQAVAMILGHSNASLTLNVYSHVSTEMQEDAMSRLDAALAVA